MENCFTYNLNIIAGCSSTMALPIFRLFNLHLPAPPARCRVCWKAAQRLTPGPARQLPLCLLPHANASASPFTLSVTQPPSPVSLPRHPCLPQLADVSVMQTRGTRGRGVGVVAKSGFLIELFQVYQMHQTSPWVLWDAAQGMWGINWNGTGSGLGRLMSSFALYS